MGAWVTMVALSALVCPSASTAGTAQVLNNTLSFEASLGEANRLTMTYEDLGSFQSRYTFEDLGAAVTPGLGCTAISAKKVSCEGGVLDITIDVRDLADSVTMPEIYRPSGRSLPCPVCIPQRFDATVAGGEGDDVLSGGHATGGGARESPLESLQGGSGDDRITSGRYAGDGGHGPYTELIGNQGDDELQCVDSFNSFCFVNAGQGADSLRGGSSRDGFVAGPGDDTIQSADNVEEEVDCGEGADRFQSDSIDRVTNCETPFDGSSTDPATRPSLGRPSVRGSRQGGFIISVITGRLTGNHGAPCGGRLRIRIGSGKRLLARRHAIMRANCLYSRRLVFPVRRLPGHQRRRFGQDKPVVLAATARYLGTGGLPSALSRTRRYRVYP
jgi:hypothetical protein